MKTIWILGGLAGTIEGEGWRDYRENQFGKYLSENGYKVIWWTANFSHHFKKFRSKSWKDIKINDNYTIRLVPTTGYKKNFSLRRYLAIYNFNKNAGKRFKKEEVPDLITGNCTMTLGYPIMQYSLKHNIPYIIDTGDIWPEFIEKNLGRFMKIGHLLFLPIYKSRKKMYSKASALIALGKNYLTFAKNIASNGNTKPSALIYNGPDLTKYYQYKKEDIDSQILHRIKISENETRCIFAGTLGPSYDIDAMIKCASMFERENEAIRIIIAGSGPKAESVAKAANKCKNLDFVGALDPDKLIPLYKNCHIGLCAYTSKSNVDMPDKFYDYIASGLAVVNSLTEEVADYIRDFNLGLNYYASDVDSLHSAIISVANNNLSQMRSNSIDLSKKFDCKVQNKKLLSLVNELIEGI